MSSINALLNEMFGIFSDIEMYKQHDKFPLEKRDKKIFATMGIAEVVYDGFYNFMNISHTYPTEIKLEVSVFASPDSSEEILYEFLEGDIIPRLYKNKYGIQNVKITGAGYSKEYDKLSLVSEITLKGYSNKRVK